MFKRFIKWPDPLDTSLGVLIRFLFSSSKRTKTANMCSTTGSWATDKIKGEERRLFIGDEETPTCSTHKEKKTPCNALSGGGQQGEGPQKAEESSLFEIWVVLRLLKSFPPLI